MSWSLSSPSGQAVSRSKGVLPELPVVIGRGTPFQGLRVDSCLTLRNELLEEVHLLTKQETLLGGGLWVESSRVREPRRASLPRGVRSQVLWSWDSFPGCLANHLACPIVWFRVLPGGTCISQPRWIPGRRTLGDWSSPSSFGPSWILPVSFWSKHHGTFFCETTWASGLGQGRWFWSTVP